MCQVWGRPTRAYWGLPGRSWLAHITWAGPAEWVGARARFEPIPFAPDGIRLCPGYSPILHREKLVYLLSWISCGPTLCQLLPAHLCLGHFAAWNVSSARTILPQL